MYLGLSATVTPITEFCTTTWQRICVRAKNTWENRSRTDGKFDLKIDRCFTAQSTASYISCHCEMKCYDDICGFLGNWDDNPDDVIPTSPVRGERRKLTSWAASESVSVSAFKIWVLCNIFSAGVEVHGTDATAVYRRIYGQCKTNIKAS